MDTDVGAGADAYAMVGTPAAAPAAANDADSWGKKARAALAVEQSLNGYDKVTTRAGRPCAERNGVARVRGTNKEGMMIDVDLLTRVTDRCRQGLERLAKTPGSMFNDFPIATCGPAAELVGRVLSEEAGYEGVYVCGSGHARMAPSQSHAWYEVGDFIVDITHDQFDGTGLSGWIFARGTGWHAEFEDLDRRAGYCMPSGWPCYPYDGYAAIKTALAE